MRRLAVLLAAAVPLTALVAVAPGAAAEPAPAAAKGGSPTVWTGEITKAQLSGLGDLGVDREDLSIGRGSAAGKLRVEAVITAAEAALLRAKGIALAEKQVDGRAASQELRAEAAEGYEVFRSYSEPGGIAEELRALTKANPSITKLVTIGKTLQGKDILAVKVTKDAAKVPDGRRPTVLYAGTQHAREWITPEMTRRLLHHYVEGYATSAETKGIIDSKELWFLPVVNPDGYDYTFTEGNRLWRKNLRDNDGDGQITGADGVDLNRNWPYRWGYDNEGSSPSWGSQTYRGTGPASEPETRAYDGLLRRITPQFLVNYHSAAELLLYGVGWQVATPTPDDVLYEAYSGDDAEPAIPGYDPDISAELYTTNGETTEHAQAKYKTLSWTPEMATCQTASAVDPDDAFDPADCESVFNFPDSEALVEAEFRKNVPFALSLAKSAADPANPVSAVGRTAPDFVVDSFDVSYGDPQTVAVTARKDLRGLRLQYSVNGGATRTAPVSEWRGGERYGDQNRVYYGEFRGQVRGAKAGDSVKVWFTGSRADGKAKPTARTSAPFTYELVQDSGAKVLVLANEDYTGVNPDYPASVTAPKYAQTYLDALKAQRIPSTVYDVDALGVPHHLGVLDHFDGVVWYLGENRLTQEPEDEVTEIGGEPYEDAAVAEEAQYLTLSVRDYLNEGGKLVNTGETAQYYGALASAIGGVFYGLDGDPEADCVVEEALDECLFVADDFSQYYLGGWSRVATESPTGVRGLAPPLQGATGTFGGPGAQANPLDEPGTFAVTSDVLPRRQFPQFASRAAATYTGLTGDPAQPVQGGWYVGGLHQDDSYYRLGRTVDLTAATAAQAPQLRFALSYDTEEAYDHVIVEARPAGTDDWTTLPEAGGRTTNAVPAECEAGFLLADHPSLERYLTPGETACTNTGTTGAWNSFTGSSDGWQQVAFDLSAYAGQQVEVVVSYVTDPATGGTGVFVDDTRLQLGGTASQAEGFETGLGPWAIQPAPEGTSPGGGSFVRSQSLLAAGVATPDSLLLGFGVEQLGTPAERADLLGRAVRGLLGGR